MGYSFYQSIYQGVPLGGQASGSAALLSDMTSVSVPLISEFFVSVQQAPIVEMMERL